MEFLWGAQAHYKVSLEFNFYYATACLPPLCKGCNNIWYTAHFWHVDIEYVIGPNILSMLNEDLAFSSFWWNKVIYYEGRVDLVSPLAALKSRACSL